MRGRSHPFSAQIPTRTIFPVSKTNSRLQTFSAHNPIFNPEAVSIFSLLDFCLMSRSHAPRGRAVERVGDVELHIGHLAALARPCHGGGQVRLQNMTLVFCRASSSIDLHSTLHSALRGGVISRFHKRGSRMHLGDPFGSLKDRSTNITPHFGILGLPGPKNGQKRPKSGQKQGKAKFWASDGPKWLDQCGSKVDLVLGRPN